MVGMSQLVLLKPQAQFKLKSLQVFCDYCTFTSKIKIGPWKVNDVCRGSSVSSLVVPAYAFSIILVYFFRYNYTSTSSSVLSHVLSNTTYPFGIILSLCPHQLALQHRVSTVQKYVHSRQNWNDYIISWFHAFHTFWLLIVNLHLSKGYS